MGVLLEKYPALFVWYSLRPPALGAFNPFDIPYAYSKMPQPPARWPRLKQIIHYFPWAWYQGRKAAAFGRAHQVNTVLADLAFEAVIAGRIAARALGVPLLVSVHDDPVSRIRIKNFPDWFIKWYECEFAKTMHSALQCGVISDYMGEIYRERYGVETHTLYIGVEEHKCLPPKMLNSDKAPIVIGSVGSLNSVENWNLLIDAVQLLNQRLGEGKFRILHIGTLPDNFPASVDVEITGWLPEKEFIHRLSEIDIGFLNWSFDPQYTDAGRTSFPLKIHSYIQAQVPMLALGPADSSVIRFVKEYGCGWACAEFGVELLASGLHDFVFNGRGKLIALEALGRLKQDFSRQAFFEKFNRFIEILP